MNLSKHKIAILAKKDFIDYFKNPSLFVSCLVPIFFIALYKFIMPLEQMGEQFKDQFLLSMGTVFSVSMCACMIISTSISEEKEKFTLRTLMLSNISAAEFFLAKVIVGYTVTIVTSIIIFVLTGTAYSKLPLYFLCATLGTLCLIMFSGIVGMIARDQMSCGVYQVPMMMLFMLPPMLAGISEPVNAFARLTPLNAMMQLFYLGVGMTEGSAMDAVFHIVVLLAWIVFSAAVFSYTYNKKGIDN